MYGRGGGGADDEEGLMSLEQFTVRWKTAVGDMHLEAEVALDLLAVSHPLRLYFIRRTDLRAFPNAKGNYLLSTSTLSLTNDLPV